MDRLTIPEYNTLMEAFQLSIVDKNYFVHWQAFLNFAVQAKRKAGKKKEVPVYRKFSKFFDYDEEIRKVKDKKKNNSERFSSIGKLLRKGGK